jgi:hypothetical protein
VIFVCGPTTKTPSNAVIINTTSHSKDFGVGLSPFHLGPVELYDGYVAKNVENAWQYAKVYERHIKDGEPTTEYFEWAKRGWSNSYAVRYPMGKGAVPEYSYWNGKKLGYIEARKEIYYPIYEKAVAKTFAFKQLKEHYKELSDRCVDLWLWDFDGFNHHELGWSLEDVMNRPEKKMGHAFVLASMLKDINIKNDFQLL